MHSNDKHGDDKMMKHDIQWLGLAWLSSLDSLEGRGLINEERNVSNSDPFYDSALMFTFYKTISVWALPERT